MHPETYTKSPDAFLRDARLPVRVMKSEDDMMREIASIMFETIANNGENPTVIICPVGPINQYPYFADMVNKARLSLKNCTFINMDEYVDAHGNAIPYDDPLSFHAIMDRMLYDRIDPALIMPKAQRLFPEPGREKEIDALIDSLGKVDCVLTGVGINGHIAFNEPPAEGEFASDDAFAACGTRILPISAETRVNNGANKLRGALDLFPPKCITLGMRQLLKAKRFKVYLYCPWQWGIMRKAALEAPSRFTPVSFLQNHPDAEMVVTEDLLGFML